MVAIENQNQAEQYLSKIKELAEKIRGLCLEIENLEYAASGVTGIRYDKERVQTSPTGDRLAVFVADAIERKAEKEEAEAELDTLKVNAYRVIRAMESIDERNVLEMMYLQCQKVSAIVEKMNYSERQIYNIKDDALLHFWEIFMSK